jgi:glycosyltransferase involved in cell wall biosynthesis
MTITIVTVCFNAAATIIDTLRSVEKQTYKDLEHVVVDGLSTDGTLDVIRRHGTRVSALVSERDRGIYDAMNKGITMATGKCVVFLNADDRYVDPDAISLLAAAMEAEGTRAAYADVAYVDQSDPSKVLRRWRSGTFRPGAFARGWAPPHPTFLAERRLLLELGGFDLRYRLASDFDLMFRALELCGTPAAYVGRELVHMRAGGATGGGPLDITRQNMEILAALWRGGVRTALPGFVVCKAISRAGQRLRTLP